MTARRELLLEARPESLAEIREFVLAAGQDVGMTAEAVRDLVLAADEIAANIVEHGYGSAQGGPIRVAFEVTGEEVRVAIEDEADCFDVATVSDPDLESDWQERQIGGLGWFLVRNLVDEIRHRPRTPVGNVYELIKRAR